MKFLFLSFVLLAAHALLVRGAAAVLIIDPSQTVFVWEENPKGGTPLVYLMKCSTKEGENLAGACRQGWVLEELDNSMEAGENRRIRSKSEERDMLTSILILNS